jgi:hypothetical protein
LVISTVVVAAVLYRVMGQKEAAAELARDDDEADVERLQTWRDYLRLIAGPFPLSVLLHVGLLLFLIITVHEQRGRDHDDNLSLGDVAHDIVNRIELECLLRLRDHPSTHTLR